MALKIKMVEEELVAMSDQILGLEVSLAEAEKITRTDDDVKRDYLQELISRQLILSKR